MEHEWVFQFKTTGFGDLWECAKCSYRTLWDKGKTPPKDMWVPTYPGREDSIQLNCRDYMIFRVQKG